MKDKDLIHKKNEYDEHYQTLQNIVQQYNDKLKLAKTQIEIPVTTIHKEVKKYDYYYLYILSILYIIIIASKYLYNILYDMCIKLKVLKNKLDKSSEEIGTKFIDEGLDASTFMQVSSM